MHFVGMISKLPTLGHEESQTGKPANLANQQTGKLANQQTSKPANQQTRNLNCVFSLNNTIIALP